MVHPITRPDLTTLTVSAIPSLCHREYSNPIAVLNKADPRVDSDMDGSRNMGASNYGPGATSGSGLTGSHNTHPTGTGIGSGTTGGYGSSNTGPHSSNLANKLDPRADSDRDGSRNAGAANYGPGATSGSGLTGSHGTHTGTGIGSGTTGTYGSSNTSGPHSSNLANKADPRVDSDMDGSRNMGASSNTGYGTTGSGLGHGTHNTVTGSGSANHGGLGHAHGGLDGPAPHTAGPHKSDSEYSPPALLTQTTAC
jgi:hypothetical protein